MKEEMKSTLITGKIGSGKTRGILFDQVQNMINKGENILVVDSKEEYYQRFSKELKEQGYKTIVINLKDTTKSNNYNPYSLPLNYYNEGNKDMAISLIQDMGLEIFKEKNSNDPFWEISASNLFTGLTLLMFKEAKHEEINLGSTSICMDLFSKKYKSTTLIEKYLDQLSSYDLIYNCMSEIVYAPADTKGSILAVAKQKIKPFILRENLLKMISCTNFDFENLEKEKTAIFVITSEENLEVNKIANILIEQVYHLVVQNKLQFNFVLDNIETLDKLLKLKIMIDMALDNFKLLIATRNYEELTSVYGESTFINLMEKYTAENVQIDNTENKALEYPTTLNKTKFFDAQTKLTEIIQANKSSNIIFVTKNDKRAKENLEKLIDNIDDKIDKLEDDIDRLL